MILGLGFLFLVPGGYCLQGQPSGGHEGCDGEGQHFVKPAKHGQSLAASQLHRAFAAGMARRSKWLIDRGGDYDEGRVDAFEGSEPLS